MTSPLIRAAPESPRLDPRCTNVSAGGRLSRCQLWAGHQGPHAVMFLRGRRRVVRSWTAHPCTEWDDLSKDYHRMAWMRGYPVADWQERA